MKPKRGKRIYLSADELHQLRRDLEMMSEFSDVPEEVASRRQAIAEKTGGVSYKQ